MTINSYRDLDVWVISMDLVDRVFTDLKSLPIRNGLLERKSCAETLKLMDRVIAMLIRLHDSV